VNTSSQRSHLTEATGARTSALLRRFKVRDTKRIFFTDKKNFYVNPPVSYQNNRVWARGEKADVKPTRLLAQREKFAKHVMVSAGVCFGGKVRLRFVQEYRVRQ